MAIPRILRTDSVRRLIDDAAGPAGLDPRGWAQIAPFVEPYLPDGANRSAPGADDFKRACMQRLEELAHGFVRDFLWNDSDDEGTSGDAYTREIIRRRGDRPHPRKKRPGGRPRLIDLQHLIAGLLDVWTVYLDRPVTTSVGRDRRARGGLVQFVRGFLDAVAEGGDDVLEEDLARRLRAYVSRSSLDAIRERIRSSGTREALTGSRRRRTRAKNAPSPTL